MISEEFLALLRCPLTSATLAIADDGLIIQINERITGGEVVNRGGDKVQQQIEGGLIDAARTLLYPIRNGIPSLLTDEAIALESTEGNSSSKGTE